MKKEMSNMLLRAAFACLVLSLPASTSRAETSKPVLRIVNWSDYIDLDESLDEALPIPERSPSLKRFAEEHGCAIEYFEFDDFGDMVSKFTDFPGFYDILIVACNNAKSVVDMGLLEAIPRERLSNYVYLDKLATSPPPDPEGTYLIPFLNDYTGLIFRSDLIPRDMVSWKNYFDPPAAWKGHIGIYDSPAAMFAAGAIASGVADYGKASAQDLKAAGATMRGIFKQRVAKIYSDFDDIEKALQKGDIFITPIYSPDANYLLKKHDNLQFVIPPEGAEFYQDYMVVHKASQNKDLAIEFINYVLDPEVSGAIAAYLGCGFPSARARAVQNRIQPSLAPSPMDARGGLLPGMHITYDLQPSIQAGWLLLMDGFDK